MYEFSGKVQEVCDIQTFGSGFTKRELIVEEGGERQYPNNVTFNFKKENIAKLDGVHAGDCVTVGFVLDGRSWIDPRTNKERHFSDLVGLTVRITARAADRQAVTPVGAEAGASESEEDYPF